MEPLNLEMHFACDLLTTGTIDALGDWLAAKNPRMSNTLEVHAYERDPDRVRVDLNSEGGLLAAVADRGLSRGELYEQLVSSYGGTGDRPRRFGSALIRGRGRGSSGPYLTIDFDSSAPLRPMGDMWIWSNSIFANVSTETVEGVPRATWIRHLGNFLAHERDFLWGAGYLHSEFEESNLDTTSGVRAIGRDASRHLPGLYWLNYFGRHYTSLMRVDVARATGIGTWTVDDDAIAVEGYATPERWVSATSDKNTIVAALGRDLFFDRRRPDRETRAPDFGVSSERRTTKRFQVFSSDGVNFTELPPN